MEPDALLQYLEWLDRENELCDESSCQMIEKTQDKVEEFFVFPPVTSHEEPVSMEETVIEGAPILETITDKHKIFENDMHNYRWTTYTKLK